MPGSGRQPRQEVWSRDTAAPKQEGKDSAQDGGFIGEVLKRLTQHNGTWQGHSVVLQAETG